MQTQNVISTTTVARNATLEVVRTLDFEKLAAASDDGRVSVEQLTSGGDWGVRVSPAGKGDPVTHDMDSQEAADAFILGFVAAVDLKARGPRAEQDFSDVEDPTLRADMDSGWSKKKLAFVAEKYDIVVKQNDSKSDIADNIATFLGID